MYLFFNPSFSPVPARHTYYLSSTGDKKAPQGTYRTRKEAEIVMTRYCQANNITLECIEDDKHSKLYSNHHGIRFCINRI